jgi:hypothetical protein
MHRSADRRWHRRARFGTAVLGIVVAATAFSACDSDGGSGANANRVPATPATTAPPSMTPLTGRLTMTGDRSLSIPRATGQCRQPTGGLPRSFVVTDPQLGPGGYVSIYAPTDVPGRGTVPPNVKVFISGTGLISAISGTGVTVAPDQQSATVDVNLGGGTGNSRNGARIPSAIMRGHISGTLRCT